MMPKLPQDILKRRIKHELDMCIRKLDHVIGIEDSGAGVASIRLAGFATIGIDGGNIKKSKTLALCSHFCQTFDEIIKIID